MRLLLLASIVLAGCRAQDAPPRSNNTVQASTSSPSPSAAAQPRALPFKIDESDELLDFAYAFPAEVAAIPTLEAQLRADMEKVRSEAARFAQEDKEAAAEMPRPYHQHYLHKEWTLGGATARLLSLVGHVESFTGGAHGNTGFALMLWDKIADKAVQPSDLLADAGALNLLRADYCKALDAERLKRREGEQLEGDFAKCPPYSDLVLAPIDSDGNGRFDRLAFLAAPYVAGPYAEGEYEIPLGVTPELMAQIKPDYRASFEAQRQ